MIRGFLFLVVFAMPLQMGPANSQTEKASLKRPLIAELEVTKKSFPRGTVPRFKLKIKNEGKAPAKVLKLRTDLQDTYYDLEVSQNGKMISVTRAISDPGPITDADYVTLKPGESVTYELKRFASAWETLPVGKYTAVVRVRPPGQSEKSFRSSEVIFEVSK
jgi:hypothetical protein